MSTCQTRSHDTCTATADTHPSEEQPTGVPASGPMGRDQLDRWIRVVHEELHRMAERQMRNERREHTLQATALVNEAYLRLAGLDEVRWESRAQFFSMAAKMMRRILIDHARAKACGKRGARRPQRPLTEASGVAVHENPEALLALHEALDQLEQLNSRVAQIVELKYFAGFSVEETAQALGISRSTVKRDWNAGRAWLYRQLRQEGAPA